MNAMTDRKYGEVTLERPPVAHPIVEGEPCFVLRGADLRTVGVLREYAMRCQLDGSPPEHIVGINRAADEIQRWQREHPQLCHRPD